MGWTFVSWKYAARFYDECYEYEQPEMVDIYFTCDMCDNTFECNWFVLMHIEWCIHISGVFGLSL